MILIDDLIAQIAPHKCLGCGKNSCLMCDDCAKPVSLAISRCYRCHQLSDEWRTCVACRRNSKLFAVVAFARHEGLPAALVEKLKYNYAIAAANNISSQLYRLIPNEPGLVITHLPTAPNRVRVRGYDQAKVIAKRLSHLSGTPYSTLLTRTSSNRQVGSGRVDRFKNSKNMFRARNTGKISGRNVIIIDDVITTGASLESAARVIKAAGAKRVYGLVFCQA